MPRTKQVHLADPAILIQSICIAWTKASRGGAAAVVRSRVPEAIPLPSVPEHSRPAFLLHFAEFREADEFCNGAPEVMSVLPASGPLRFGRLLIRPFSESAEVVYLLQRPEWAPSTQHVQAAYLPGRLGTGLTPCYVEPPQLRIPEHQPAFRLGPGEWGRVTYNWRYSHGYWRYERWTFNIALLGVEPVSSTLFLERTPSHVLTRLSRLF